MSGDVMASIVAEPVPTYVLVDPVLVIVHHRVGAGHAHLEIDGLAGDERGVRGRQRRRARGVHEVRAVARADLVYGVRGERLHRREPREEGNALY